MVSVFLESVFLPQRRFCLLRLICKVCLPAGTEVDMPPPEAAEERLGILVILSPEFTGLTGVVLLGHNLFTCQFLVHLEQPCHYLGLAGILGEAVGLQDSGVVGAVGL